MPPPKKPKMNGGKISSHATTRNTDEQNALFDLAMALAFIAKGIRPSINVHETVDILYYAIQDEMDLADAVAIGELIRSTKDSDIALQ